MQISAASRNSGSRSPSKAGSASPSSSLSFADRKSTRLNSSHSQISYAVFCLKKKKKNKQHHVRRSRDHRARRKQTTHTDSKDRRGYGGRIRSRGATLPCCRATQSQRP